MSQQIGALKILASFTTLQGPASAAISPVYRGHFRLRGTNGYALGIHKSGGVARICSDLAAE